MYTNISPNIQSSCTETQRAKKDGGKKKKENIASHGDHDVPR
jgi:hypothetical protein